MTFTVCFARPWCWRPRLAGGGRFLGWRFCWLLVAVAAYPMDDFALFQRIGSGSTEWLP